MPLPRVFFDFTINGVPSGRVVFELSADICPKTCENFRCLCTGEKGEGKTTFKPLHYKGTPVHRIVKGFIVQGGDFSAGDGTGGESIYGGMFKDENFQLKHDQPFLLSMANKGPNTNGSQFFITTRPAHHLDGVHVVFGRVIQGEQFVVEIENQKVDTNHRPYSDVRISNCGELVLVKASKASRSKRSKVEESSSTETETSSSSDESSSESESESESSEEERRKRERKRRRKRKEEKKKKEERKRKKRRKRRERKKGGKHRKSKPRSKKRKQEESESDSDSDSESDRSELEDESVPPPDEAVTSTISEDVLPSDVVSTSRSWLYRSSRSPSPKADSEKKQSGRQKGSESSFKSRENQVSESGRKLKGRGIMRYRTPPRFRGEFEDRAIYAERRRWDQHFRRSRSRSRERPRRWRHSPSPTYRQKPQSLKRRHSASPEGPERQFHRREKSRSRSPVRHGNKKERGRHSHRPHSPNERHGKRQGARERSTDRERDAEHQPRREVSGVMKSDEDSESTSEHRIPQLKQRDHERKSYSHSPSPVSRKKEQDRKRSEKHRNHHSLESDESSCSSSNKMKKSSKGRKRHRRSRSRSSTPRRYQKASSHHRRHSRRDESSSSDSKPFTSSSLPSKWARHHDSTGSSSDEDHELEKAYQRGSRGRRTSDTEDVFGIAELT